MNNWLVIGGGVRGIIAASLLASRGQHVTLIEQAPRLGGVLNSKKQRGLYLDFGCHLFGKSGSQATTLLKDILGNNASAINVRYASVTEGQLHEDIAVPDFTHLSRDTLKSVIHELVLTGAKYDDDLASPCFEDLLKKRYGQTLSERLIPAVRKICQADAEELDANTLSKTPLGRIRLFADDQVARWLKQLRFFDDVIAVPMQGIQSLPGEGCARTTGNYYPAKKGMRGFSDAAEDYLAHAGVNMVLGQKVIRMEHKPSNISITLGNDAVYEAEHMLWASDPGHLEQLLTGANNLQSLAHPVPMILYYFLVPADTEVKYTYLHDYSENTRIYRASSPGFYGHQVNEQGLSYLCAEVPTNQQTEIWAGAEEYSDEIWKEMRELGMVDLDTPPETIVLQTPVSYPLCKTGYSEAVAAFEASTSHAFPRIHLGDPAAYAKNDIVETMQRTIDAVLNS